MSAFVSHSLMAFVFSGGSCCRDATFATRLLVMTGLTDSNGHASSSLSSSSESDDVVLPLRNINEGIVVSVVIV